MTLAHLHTCPRCDATFDCMRASCAPCLAMPCAACGNTPEPLALKPLFDMVYEGRWFTINRLPREGKRKTDTYEVLTKECEVIGHIAWYGPWRKYAYFPENGSVMESQCLSEIADFLVELMQVHRVTKR